jgi:peptidyl-prolyl cis-trans isomerase A (cyclophilin A)
MKCGPKLLVVSTILLALASHAGLAGAEPAASEPDLESMNLPDNLAEGWYARIETSMGRIAVQLLPRQAPQSVAHFAALAEAQLEWTDPLTGEVRKNHFYDGTEVHKAVAGERFEAGSPSGTGRGGPVMWVSHEEAQGPVDFSYPGRLGMTRASGRRVSAYQFFVTASAQPHFSGRHPCFGVVVSGMEVVIEITGVKTYSNGRPVEPVTIEKIRIFKIGEPPPLADPVPHQPTPAEFKAKERPATD